NRACSSSIRLTACSTSIASPLAAAMRVDVFSIFPDYFEGPVRASLLGRARERGLIDLRVHDPREHATDTHRTVDDTPFGGGAGRLAAPAVPAVGGRATVRPADRRAACATRRLLVALRPVRGGRPARRRPPLRRRALGRRLRASRR